jgi:hypothetical protein
MEAALNSSALALLSEQAARAKVPKQIARHSKNTKKGDFFIRISKYAANLAKVYNNFKMIAFALGIVTP